MCRIFEIAKEAMCASFVSGIIIVSLKKYDVLIVPEGAEHLLAGINPDHINRVRMISGKPSEVVLELIQEKKKEALS